jgi:hypothetical protein
MISENTVVEEVANRVWEVFSIVNGNPDYNFSSIRFSLSLFFLALLYQIVRMRIISSYQLKHIVALTGIIFMMFREATMLVMMTGWELKVFYDPIVQFLWPPIEHTFSGLAFLCFVWYSVETAKMYKLTYYIRKAKYYILLGYGLFTIYAMTVWKAFYIEHAPNILYEYKECPIDWITHGLFSLFAAVGFYAAFQKQAKFLMLFWGVTLFEHFTRTLVFYAHFETPEIATFFHSLHTWALPLLVLHFVSAYVAQISNCGVCKRDILI